MSLLNTRPIVFGLIVFVASVAVAVSADPPGSLETTAEQSNFTATSRQEQVEHFLHCLDRRGPRYQRLKLGQTVEARPIEAIVLASPPVKNASMLVNDPRLVVLLIGNIHAGECAGKEAILALLRDLDTPDLSAVLKQLVVIAVPNLNADANEQQGPKHRPGQLGPTRGMGIRRNIQGLDLNRDFTKLETPEIRSLVRFINEWNPHLVIDTHTTNGSRHRYDLTYDIPHNPASPSASRQWLRKTFLPAITDKLRAQGINTTYYGNFNKDHTRWTTFGHEPRYSTEYMGLRGKIALLSEAYSYVSYSRRITAHYAFLATVLRQVAASPTVVRDLVNNSSLLPADRLVPVRARNSAYPEPIVIEAYEPLQESANRPVSTLKHRDYTVEYHGNFVASLEVKTPYAYLIPVDEARAASLLLAHGVEVHRLQKPTAIPLRQQRVSDLTFQKSSLERHRILSLEITPSPVTTQEHPAGTFIVLSQQPLSQLATYLLSPLADDGLTAWNFFDHAIRKERAHPVALIPESIPLPLQRLTTPPRTSRLTLDKIYGPSGRIQFGGSFPLGLRWLPDSSQYVTNNGDRTYHVDAETSARELAPSVDKGTVRDAIAQQLDLSPGDATKIINGRKLVATEKKRTLYWNGDDLLVYDPSSTQVQRLASGGGPRTHVSFSPDAHYLAYSRDANLMLAPTDGSPEIPVTQDGSSTNLYGVLDWVYQEELYGRGNFRGYWWSPDSSRLAFLHLDETPVSKYTVADHLAYRNKEEATYYPKAGDPLPRVRLAIYTIASKHLRWVDLEHYGEEFLISRVTWSPDSRHVYAQLQNREQTWLDLKRVDAGTGERALVIRESSPAWVQSPGDPLFLSDGSLLWLSESSGYRHIQRILTRRRRRARSLTGGPWEVQRLLGLDESSGYVYFLANRESGQETHAYRVPLSGGEPRRLTLAPGNHSVRFNDSYTHFIDYVSGVDQPISVHLHRADGTRIRTLAPNLVDHLQYYALNRPEFVSYPARDGHSLTSVLIKPPGFDPRKRYPVLCHVYGGPQAPVVRNRWSGSTYLWHQFLAQQGYVIWITDNRASTHEGVQAAWSIHRKLGETELRDLEDGVRWLTKHPWADGDRVGVWGWSYGGYLTSYAMTHSDLFKAGIAGAPVTDWRNYDAIYTERYMGTPKANPEGYRDSSPVHAAANLQGRLLLIHGSLDDNVHLSNTLQFSHALQESGKQFDLMIYPNNKHGITRPQQSRHLRDLMTRFILDHL